MNSNQRNPIQLVASSQFIALAPILPLLVNIQFTLTSFQSKTFREDGFIKRHKLCSHLSPYVSRRNFNILTLKEKEAAKSQVVSVTSSHHLSF